MVWWLSGFGMWRSKKRKNRRPALSFTISTKPLPRSVISGVELPSRRLPLFRTTSPWRSVTGGGAGLRFGGSMRVFRLSSSSAPTANMVYKISAQFCLSN